MIKAQCFWVFVVSTNLTSFLEFVVIKKLSSFLYFFRVISVSIFLSFKRHLSLYGGAGGICTPVLSVFRIPSTIISLAISDEPQRMLRLWFQHHQEW